MGFKVKKLIKKLIKNIFINSNYPRQPPSPKINAFGAPCQSRSFKILQQVTGTMGDDSDDNYEETKAMADETPMQEQRAIFSRPLEHSDMNENQLRRLQLSENDRALMNRVKQQGNFFKFLVYEYFMTKNVNCSSKKLLT